MSRASEDPPGMRMTTAASKATNTRETVSTSMPVTPTTPTTARTTHWEKTNGRLPNATTDATLIFAWWQ